jgi:O-antigen/teichoic acid export membrane protein
MLRFFLKVAGGLFCLGLTPMLIVGVWGEELWKVFLGNQWSDAGRIAAVIAPWALMQFAVSPVSRLVTVLHGQEMKLVYDVLGLLSVTGILTLGSRRGWSIVETCSALGWSQALVYGIYFVLLFRIVKTSSGRQPSSV